MNDSGVKVNRLHVQKSWILLLRSFTDFDHLIIRDLQLWNCGWMSTSGWQLFGKIKCEAFLKPLAGFYKCFPLCSNVD